MLKSLTLPNTFSEGRFWLVFSFSETLLILDCITTVIILEVCGGVELNPIVRTFGLFNITVYKLVATAFVGLVSHKKKFLWLLYAISLIFTVVVVWNLTNILLVI
jgi:hypothetical protein